MDPTLPPFIYEILTYLDSQSTYFSFDEQTTGNLKIGELSADVPGVFVVQSASDEPDRYTEVEYYTLDFWAVNANSEEAFLHLREIYRVFHQADHYNTNSFKVFFSHATSSVQDMDRDIQGRKMLKLSVRFITVRLIS